MRLWHKDLIPYLPKNQLLGQWREICCIAKNIANNGTPNHILVNKVLDYPSIHFITYANMITTEMKKRNYKISEKSYLRLCENIRCAYPYFNKDSFLIIKNNKVFPDWHNTRYLRQCLFNLQEKADCNGITINEWQRIKDKFGDICNENDN